MHTNPVRPPAEQVERRIGMAILAEAVDAILAMDEAGAIVWANPGAARMFRRAPDELVGAHVTVLMPEPDRGRHGGDVRSHLDGGRPRAIGVGREVLGRRGDGTTFPAHLAVSEMEVGGRRLFAGVVRDMSAEREARSVLEDERARGRAVAAAMSEGLAICDPDGVVTDCNAGFARMVGRDRADVLGARAPYPWWPPEDAARLGSPAGERAPGGVRRVEASLQRADGSRFPAIITIASLSPGGGADRGCAIVVTDATGRLRAEEAERSAAVERQVAREQAALRRVATAVAAEVPPRRLFALVAREAANVLGLDVAGVMRFEDDGATAVVMGTWSRRETPAAGAGSRFPLAAGGTATALVATTGRPARVDSYAEVPAVVEEAAHVRTFRHGVSAPVRVGGALWGALTVATEADRPMTDDDEGRLERFAELVGLAIAGAEARARLTRLAAMDHVTGIANARTFEESLEVEVERARHRGVPLSLIVFDLDHFKEVNDLHGHTTGNAVLAEVARRLRDGAREGELVARIGGEEFAWLLPDTDGPGAVEAADRARRAIAADPAGVAGVRASAGVCELAQAGGAGELVRLADVALYWAKSRGRDTTVLYSRDTLEVLSAPEQARRLARADTLASVRSLARAVDAKDPATQRHSERVAGLARRLARALGWSAERADDLHEAALIHDVGKIGIPDALLLAPHSLTAAERGLVRRHVELGATMVAGALGADQVAWVRGHHERWDGTGYPDGLAGEEIPEGARILAVADAWDAMTVARLYGEPMPAPAAAAEMRAGRGTQFWPRAVDTLIALQAAGLLPVDRGAPRRAAAGGSGATLAHALDRCVAIAGAGGGAVYRLAGDRLTIAAERSWPEAMTDPDAAVPVGAHVPIADAAAGLAVWEAGREGLEARYPVLAALRRDGDAWGGLAALPARAGGKVVGVVALALRPGAAPSPATRSRLERAVEAVGAALGPAAPAG